MKIADHKVVKILNGILRKAQMQELYPDEAEMLVLHFMERYRQLENDELVFPCKQEYRFMPATYMKGLFLVARILLEELMDLLFIMRGVESVYCLRGRNYHENREGDQS